MIGASLYFVVNNCDFFLSHRSQLGRQAIRLFTEVHLVSPNYTEPTRAYLKENGIHWSRMPLFREKLNIFSLIRTLVHAFKIGISGNENSIYHLITIIPIILYGIPLRLLGKKIVFAITGMGTVFTSKKVKYRVLRTIVCGIYRFLFRYRQAWIIVQNADDYQFILSLGVQENRITQIKGSGVDPNEFSFEPKSINKEHPKILLAARLIKEKGIMEMCQTSKVLVDCFKLHHEVIIAGSADPGNKLAFTLEEIDNLKKISPHVKFLGHVPDIRSWYKECDIVCLPSYREGLPKSLIEAFAIGRPVVTYDTIGCREIVQNYKNGLLAPLKSVDELANCIHLLTKDENLRELLVKNAHNDFLSTMTVASVIHKTFEVYRRCVGGQVSDSMEPRIQFGE